jgi:hypothetical protein
MFNKFWRSLKLLEESWRCLLLFSRPYFPRIIISSLGLDALARQSGWESRRDKCKLAGVSRILAYLERSLSVRQAGFDASPQAVCYLYSTLGLLAVILAGGLDCI